MSQRSVLPAALGLIGVLALVLYLLACRPSWSPDGSRILFPFADSSASGIVLADLTSGTARLLFVEGPGPDGKRKETVGTVQWSRDGRQAVAALADNDRLLRLIVLPLEAGQAARLIPLESSDFSSVLPVPERDDRVFLSARTRVSLDLRSGRTLVVREDSTHAEVSLADWGAKVMYERGDPGNGDDLEFGELDLDSLTLAPLLRLPWADLRTGLAKAGLDPGQTSGGLFAPDPARARVALTVETPAGCGVVGVKRGARARVLRPFPAGYALGNLEWSHDGGTLYAPVLTITPRRDTARVRAPVFSFTVESDTARLCVGEIPLGGGPARLDPVARVSRDTSWNAADGIFYQVALSPDGGRIAVTTTRGEPLGEPDRGLFVVDLRDPRRPVTRIGMPALPGAK